MERVSARWGLEYQSATRDLSAAGAGGLVLLLAASCMRALGRDLRLAGETSGHGVGSGARGNWWGRVRQRRRDAEPL